MDKTRERDLKLIEFTRNSSIGYGITNILDQFNEKFPNHAHDPTTNEGGWIRQPDKPQENTESQEELWKEFYEIFYNTKLKYYQAEKLAKERFTLSRRTVLIVS